MEAGASDAEAGDLFEALFMAGVEDVEPPTRTKEEGRELLARAVPAEAVALHGCVLGPERAIEDAYVVVGAGSEIQAVSEEKPQGVRVLETDGVILPGLIDLHGHPEFNVFAAWEPPQQFVNRYAWRGSDVYRELVREPQNRLLAALPARTQLRYAEVRALVCGVTAIQGASGKVKGTEEALVRNVDLWVFGSQRARAMIDLPSESSRDMERLKGILTGIEAREVKAFYVHLAEGRSDNERSQREFDRLVALKALTDATVVIHGTALAPAQFGDLADAGAKLVWSPQSNLRLYSETTNAAEAMKRGVLVGLGADWLPSGSASLLAEMKVARRSLRTHGYEAPARKLVEMVTSDAAKIAGLDDKLGSLQEGRPADLVVLERHHSDPWENVVEADPGWVDLVMVDGDLAYGRADWMTTLTDPGDRDHLEPVIAWGQEMLLDTSYMARPTTEEPPTLAELRAALIQSYPPVGPIFA